MGARQPIAFVPELASGLLGRLENPIWVFDIDR